MKVGSCAAESYEPRQVRKEATVNSRLRVTQVYLVRVGWPEQAEEYHRQPVHGPFDSDKLINVPQKKIKHFDHAGRLLHSTGIKARKSLGQNFLIDNSVRDAIINEAGLSVGDTVIEVGPGMGVLTGEIARRAGRVVAVELDGSLARYLQQKMKRLGNVEVICSDILKLDLMDVLHGSENYKVVANIPYYITSPVLHYFMNALKRPLLMIIMMQKEVAEAITAPPGRMNFLSVSMRIYSHPSIVCRAPAASFYPAPAVDSAVVRFDMLPKPAVNVENPENFLQLIHYGFSAPRKMIRNSLAIGLKMEPDEADKILSDAGIDPQRRPATLSLDEWALLYKAAGGTLCSE